jgi:hypothetical protein
VNHARAYRALLHLYPRSFRRAWQHELELAFRDQLVHPIRPTKHPASRAWAVTARDLATSLPRQRLEQVMTSKSSLSRRVSVTLPTIGVIAAGAVLSSRLFLLFPLLVILGVLYAIRRRLDLANVFATGLRWYELVGLGLGVLITIGVGAALLPDFEGIGAELLWLLALTSFLLGWSLIILGAIAAAAAVWRRVRTRSVA